MVSLEAYSELLEVLYSAPLEYDQWSRFLALLGRHTQSPLSVLICADTRLGLSVRAKGSLTPEAEQGVITYNESYGRSDPFRAAILRNPRTGIFYGDDLVPFETLQASSIYRDVIGPFGGRFCTILLLSISLRRMEAISIWRTSDDGRLDPECDRLLRLLFPHIRKALEIRQVLGVAQQRAAGAEAMIDVSATPTFLLSRKGSVLHRNAAAEALLQERDGLVLHGDCLAATDPRSREALRDLLLHARLPDIGAYDASSPPLPPLVLQLERSANRRPLQLFASPLTPAHRSRSGADVVLLVTDPEKPVNVPDDALRTLFGFTPAQVEVAIGLLMGYSLEEIATLRKVSVGTVRNQLKAMLSKTSTSRQSDLVRLLMTLPQASTAN